MGARAGWLLSGLLVAVVVVIVAYFLLRPNELYEPESSGTMSIPMPFLQLTNGSLELLQRMLRIFVLAHSSGSRSSQRCGPTLGLEANDPKEAFS